MVSAGLGDHSRLGSAQSNRNAITTRPRRPLEIKDKSFLCKAKSLRFHYKNEIFGWFLPYWAISG